MWSLTYCLPLFHSVAASLHVVSRHICGIGPFPFCSAIRSIAVACPATSPHVAPCWCVPPAVSSLVTWMPCFFQYSIILGAIVLGPQKSTTCMNALICLSLSSPTCLCRTSVRVVAGGGTSGSSVSYGNLDRPAFSAFSCVSWM